MDSPVCGRLEFSGRSHREGEGGGNKTTKVPLNNENCNSGFGGWVELPETGFWWILILCAETGSWFFPTGRQQN
ncbi:hypothetical protein Csa_002148 [Cucumis sativus]|uniref:Uncharacterized protein n=1 Tax=Cucumis sativus TaxID=3659 RepID=A0A0A0LES2_CUCSA|nr:hypothetical protein Csa_002148 [Cucumis sativus]